MCIQQGFYCFCSIKGIVYKIQKNKLLFSNFFLIFVECSKKNA